MRSVALCACSSRGRAAYLGNAAARNPTVESCVHFDDAGSEQFRGLLDFERQGGGNAVGEPGLTLQTSTEALLEHYRNK